jgi:putative nucleotidyltransferase with HDIG domain
MKPQYRIVLLYLALGSLWIFASDLVVDTVVVNQRWFTLAQNIKGWFFVILTALLLFFLIRRDFTELARKNEALRDSYDQAVQGWVRVMDVRHQETKNHTERVAKMSVELAKLAGVTLEAELKCIERGAILHDIGKIGIPDAILLKQGKLTDEEHARMRQHPDIAREILSAISFLGPSTDVPYCHHEKWDGTGYPRGVRGEEIPYSARLFAVIDVWDALIHPRVYKAAWPEDDVLRYIADQSGKHFDPSVVRLFLQNYAQIKAGAVMESDLMGGPESGVQPGAAGPGCGAERGS